MLEVALFPIPNLVAFPGVELPLHVFEPRYRRLVHESVEADRYVGVCHVTKTIREAPKDQTVETALSTNQGTYQPQPVFSAGPCEILSEMDDGRLLARVDVRERLTLVDEIQSLPYRVVTCEPLEDLPEPVADKDNALLKDQIQARLIAIVEKDNPKVAAQLGKKPWTSMSPAEYSFGVFRLLRFDADTMQEILETRTANERLQTISAVVTGVPNY